MGRTYATLGTDGLLDPAQAPPGGGAPTIQDEGVGQGTAGTLDFVGTGVSAAVAAGVATITVSGGTHPDLATHDGLGLATDAELTTHAGAADPHTGYRLESADHTHASAGAQAGLVAHSALSGLTNDEHTQYQKESEKAAASGYASLDSGTKVPIAQIPTGTSGVTVALGDAAAGLITTHEGAANPHSTYLTQAEGDAAYQPVDSDLTAIAALTTTSFGRALLGLADGPALAGVHSHGGAGADPVQGAYAPGSFTLVTGKYAIMGGQLELTGSQSATIEGTGQLQVIGNVGPRV